MLNLGALEEAESPVNAVRNALREKRMLNHARLRIRAVEHGDMRKPRAVTRERLDFLDDPARLVIVRFAFEDAHRLALAGRSPQVLAQAIAVVRNERVRGVEDVAVRAVILLEANHVLHLELPLEVAHVTDVRAAEGIDGLVVVAHAEISGVLRAEKLQPPILQAVGVLELVDQDVAEAARIVLAQDLVARE